MELYTQFHIFHSLHYPIQLPQNKQMDTTVLGKVHPCTGTEALYRPYGP